MITSEDDVRAWVRKVSGGKARWVEPALGSTPGLPDCWVVWPKGRRTRVDLELKAAEVVKGQIRYHVRPEQKRQLKSMAEDGLAVGFLVGIVDSNAFVFLPIDRDSLAGRVSLTDGVVPRLWAFEESPEEQFWAGVNFIFLER